METVAREEAEGGEADDGMTQHLGCAGVGWGWGRWLRGALSRPFQLRSCQLSCHSHTPPFGQEPGPVSCQVQHPGDPLETSAPSQGSQGCTPIRLPSWDHTVHPGPRTRSHHHGQWRPVLPGSCFQSWISFEGGGRGFKEDWGGGEGRQGQDPPKTCSTQACMQPPPSSPAPGRRPIVFGKRRPLPRPPS